MIRRDDEGIIGTRPKERADDLPLWSQPDVRKNAASAPIRAGFRAAVQEDVPSDPFFGKASGPGAREFVKRALLPLLLEEAKRSAHAIPPGFTADDIRAIALERDLGTGDEKDQRAWSWIGPWLSQLARRGAIAVLRDTHGHQIERPSQRPEAHSNDQTVYTAADAVPRAA